MRKCAIIKNIAKEIYCAFMRRLYACLCFGRRFICFRMCGLEFGIGFCVIEEKGSV